jgi:hypothetical protein
VQERSQPVGVERVRRPAPGGAVVGGDHGGGEVEAVHRHHHRRPRTPRVELGEQCCGEGGLARAGRAADPHDPPDARRAGGQPVGERLRVGLGELHLQSQLATASS